MVRYHTYMYIFSTTHQADGHETHFDTWMKIAWAERSEEWSSGTFCTNVNAQTFTSGHMSAQITKLIADKLSDNSYIVRQGRAVGWQECSPEQKFMETSMPHQLQVRLPKNCRFLASFCAFWTTILQECSLTFNELCHLWTTITRPCTLENSKLPRVYTIYSLQIWLDPSKRAIMCIYISTLHGLRVENRISSFASRFLTVHPQKRS